MKFKNIKILVLGAVVLMTASGCGDLDQYNQEKLGNPEIFYC